MNEVNVAASADATALPPIGGEFNDDDGGGGAVVPLSLISGAYAAPLPRRDTKVDVADVVVQLVADNWLFPLVKSTDAADRKS